MFELRGSFAVAAAAAALIAAPAGATLTVETTNFITAPTATTSFEGLGAVTGSDGVTAYSENGISVSYVGAIVSGGIWSELQPTTAGQYSWYPDGGGYGYTDISFSDATALQFLVGSGWNQVDPPSLSYQVLLDGVVIGSGTAGPAPLSQSGWATYGFSGATFDEVRLQVLPVAGGFDPEAYEAGAFDAIAIVQETPGVPEPATWATMMVGFALVGGARRARRGAVAPG